MIRRPPRSTQSRSSAASDVYKRQFGGLAEFLRVDHVSGESGQYITRSIATMMHSRIESRIAIRATDVVEAMEERFSEYIVRGGDASIVSRLRKKYYNYVSEEFGMCEEDFYRIKKAHRVVGGVSNRNSAAVDFIVSPNTCLLYTSPSPRDS